jgi:hypothetical protein
MKTKNSLLLLTAAILFFFLVASCSDKSTPPQPNKYEISDTNYSWQNEVARFLSRDFRLTNSSEDGSEKVERVISGNLHGHFLFSNLIRSGGDLGSGSVMSFIDLSKAEKRNICPDPLCSHKREVCKYTDFSNLVSFGNEKIYYDSKMISDGTNNYCGVFEIITDNDSVKEIYRPAVPDTSDEYAFISVANVTERFVFFIEHRVSMKIIDSDFESGNQGEEYREETHKYYRYIRATGKTEHLFDVSGVEFDEIAEPKTDGTGEVEFSHLIITEDKVYFCDYSEYFKVINHRSVDIPDGYKVMGSDCIYRDIPTGDIWLGFRTKNEEDVENFKGYICRLKENGELERISMPADNIYGFTLTDKYIYYTVFDPVIYGYAREGVVCSNETKSRMWRVPRETLENSELILDGKCEFLFPSGPIIYGDCIYIDYCKLMKMEGSSWYRRMGSVVAINFVENTIKWFNLD